MIPKIIHYCWVGGNPKPQSVLYCIESWKRFCPDYEILEWNESNYDFKKNKYMKQAYEAKKWGFVPDYARLDIIYEHGGIYLDTDVELIRSFDCLLKNECFFGFEETGDGVHFVNCGHGFGAVPHHEVIKNARDLYEHILFTDESGTMNLLPSPHYTTQSLRLIGLKQENCDQRLAGVQIYASDVLCPKNFRTGGLHKTDRTVSIHHFTASWVDEKIKTEMEHQRSIKNRFGDWLGGYILVAESVTQKYTPVDMVTKLPVRLAQKLKYRLACGAEMIPYYVSLFQARLSRVGAGKTIILDTSLGSDNVGDSIIMENCLIQLSDCMSVEKLDHIPTHRFPTSKEREMLFASCKKILCGTNILSGHIRQYGLWKLSRDVTPYRNTVLMGVGFDSKKQTFDRYTQWMMHTILDKKIFHSVRDSFSEEMLKSMGIANVLNTGCPTMWGLTPEHCAKIPTTKATNVICTITDYNRDEKNDKAMLDILLKNYNKVYLWLQGKYDLDYVRELHYESQVELIGSTMDAYDAILEIDDLDYVGTRLHAGIRALSKGHRSLIVSIDNRAECISADTGLPIIQREDVAVALSDRIHGSFATDIILPWGNITRWKEQFNERKYHED